MLIMAGLLCEYFYSCFTESVLTFTIHSWYSLLKQKNQNRLQGIVKVCCKVAGTAPNDLSQLRLRALRKTRSILAVPSHPLEEEFELLLQTA